MNNQTVRPTKKQRELLTYIEQFIGEHGYSPSYREIMNGVGYTSVATVSLHVNSLIRRGHLRKRDRSARSLEVVTITEGSNPINEPQSHTAVSHEQQWLTDKVLAQFLQAESSERITRQQYDDMAALVRTMEVLGIKDAAANLQERLNLMREQAV